MIDTGVNASPRVPAEPGGDFIDAAGDGLSDCDSHGTITASIIAGRGAPTDAFIGVAPDARLISLRQTSEAFEPVDVQVDPNDPNTTPAAASIRSLARAIVHAANLDAGVINISEAACFKVARPVDQASLGAALNYAVNFKGAVVVVAAATPAVIAPRTRRSTCPGPTILAAGRTSRRSSRRRGTTPWC